MGEMVVAVDGAGDLGAEVVVDPPGVREIELEDEHDLLETVFVEAADEVGAPRRMRVPDASKHEGIEDDRCSTDRVQTLARWRRQAALGERIDS
jgi:hypothetical protein